jgi:hypothetical protein
MGCCRLLLWTSGRWRQRGLRGGGGRGARRAEGGEAAFLPGMGGRGCAMQPLLATHYLVHIRCLRLGSAGDSCFWQCCARRCVWLKVAPGSTHGPRPRPTHTHPAAAGTVSRITYHVYRNRYIVYIDFPNGPIQRTTPVRYVQYECYEATARSETRKLARVRPARCPA